MPNFVSVFHGIRFKVKRLFVVMTSNFFLPSTKSKIMATEKDKFTYMTLSNGLRIVHCHSRSQAEYCGLAVKAGSRNETPDTYGIAHFVEHTIFKGTDRRKSWHIINRMEAVGGELNAYTSEEVTMVYSAFPKGNLSRAVELIADLVANSRFPIREIDKEREVVMDEISSYLDTPSDAIFDDFNDMMFAGSPLGHNILGNTRTISTFTPATCRSFLDRYYTPGNMVLFYLGPTSTSRLYNAADRYFSVLHHPTEATSPVMPAVNKTFDVTRDINSHQCHTVIGARIPGMFEDRKRVFGLLTNILGGPCMNSLFNVELRERHGYVYSVDAYTSLFTDCGLFTVYFGCDEEHVGPCRRMIFDIIDRLADTPMSKRALDAAKKQYLGQSLVAGENREQFALSMGRSVLFNGKIISSSEVMERINSITPEELREAAGMISRNYSSILTFS